MSDEKSSLTGRGTNSPATASRSEVDRFLAELKTRASNVHGRLIMAIDATASRQPTWDTACALQADMFREAASVGGLDMQLVYYRGLEECRASKWISDPTHLARIMSQIMCNSGHTQIQKTLSHAKKETKLLKVSAMVFVGDAMEENPDALAHEAGELGRLGVPVFMFQEGRDHEVEQVFREIARLTRGAYCRFDMGAAHQLRELLRAVAVYAAGGVAALAARNDAGAIKLLGQVGG
jgi:hypothetical protein